MALENRPKVNEMIELMNSQLKDEDALFLVRDDKFLKPALLK